MRVYLDTSVIFSMLAKDALNDRAESFLRQPGLLLLISDFGAAEFASIVARKVRVGEMTHEGAAEVFSTFENGGTTSHRQSGCNLRTSRRRKPLSAGWT